MVRLLRGTFSYVLPYCEQVMCHRGLLQTDVPFVFRSRDSFDTVAEYDVMIDRGRGCCGRRVSRLDGCLPSAVTAREGFLLVHISRLDLEIL